MRSGRRSRTSWTDEVVVDVSEKDGIRSLHLGSEAIQSSMRVRSPVELVLGYSRCMFAFLLFRDAPHSVLTLGLGGGSIPKFLYHHFPLTQNTVLELHPQVIGVARSMFHVPPNDERLRVIEGDACTHIANMEETVDVIFHDAFGPSGIAEVLATEDFFGQCRERLSHDGCLMVNLWGSDPKFQAYVDRLGRAFDSLVLCLPARQRGNITAICFKRCCNSPTWDRLRERAGKLEAQYGLEFSEFVSDLSRMNPHNDRRLLI